MILGTIARPLAQPIVHDLDRAVFGRANQFPADLQGASLVLDFVADVYGLQNAAEAEANALNPRPSLLLDFTDNLYFVEA